MGSEPRPQTNYEQTGRDVQLGNALVSDST